MAVCEAVPKQPQVQATPQPETIPIVHRAPSNSLIYRLNSEYINSNAPLIYYDTEWSYRLNTVSDTYINSTGGSSSAVTTIYADYPIRYDNITGESIYSSSAATISYNLYASTNDNGDIIYLDSYCSGVPVQLSKKDQLRHRIRQNLSSGPYILKARAGRPVSSEEERARNLLRRIIGEREYALFLRKGFLTVRGKTGLVYQIPMGRGMIACYHPSKNGKYKLFQRICVQFVDWKLPPTDALIMRKLLIENDEVELRRRSNVFSVNSVSPEEQKGISDFLVGAA